MSVPHEEIPRVVGLSVAAGAAVGLPVLAFDFVGLAAVMGAAGALLTTAVAGYIALKTAQVHKIVNSTATALKSENLAEITAVKAERDALRADLDRANAASLAKAEGQLIQQATPPKEPLP